MIFIILIIIAYLLGSISSAVLVAKAFNLPDPRESGSENPGATNVLRLSGKKMAALVFLGDFLKGLIPVLLGLVLAQPASALPWIGLAAMLGHIFPVFFQFRGGKGVATVFGVYLGLNLWMALLIGLIWAVTAKVYRYSSLAALVATASAPILCLFFNAHFFFGLIACALLVFWRHQDNIQRLRAGTEPKIKSQSAANEP